MGRTSEQTFLQRRFGDGQHAHKKMLDITNAQTALHPSGKNPL